MKIIARLVHRFKGNLQIIRIYRGSDKRKAQDILSKALNLNGTIFN